MKKTLRQGIKRLERLILKQWKARSVQNPYHKQEVHIHVWDQHGAGMRIAEIGFVSRPKDGSLRGAGGSSFMQSSPTSAAVIFAAERLILDWTYFPSDAKDSLERFTEALWNKEP